MAYAKEDLHKYFPIGINFALTVEPIPDWTVLMSELDNAGMHLMPHQQVETDVLELT